MNSARITYTPRPDATSEAELNALAACYRFVLNCHEKKKAARPGGRDDVRKGQDAHTATQKYNG